MINSQHILGVAIVVVVVGGGGGVVVGQGSHDTTAHSVDVGVGHVVGSRVGHVTTGHGNGVGHVTTGHGDSVGHVTTSGSVEGDAQPACNYKYSVFQNMIVGLNYLRPDMQSNHHCLHH